MPLYRVDEDKMQNVNLVPCNNPILKTPSIDPLINIVELSAILRISRDTIYKNVRAGILPKPIMVGRRARGWNRTDILNFLEHGACPSDNSHNNNITHENGQVDI